MDRWVGGMDGMVGGWVERMEMWVDGLVEGRVGSCVS